MKLEKITKQIEPGGHRRWYEDACGTAHALELVGERWALLVVRELMFGPRRFSDLRAALPGISANILTQRLEGLERAGIVERSKLPPPASAQVYGLTAWGYESEPIFQTLGRWAARSPDHDPGLPLSAVSLMLSLRTMIDKRRADAIHARIGFQLGDDSFLAELAQGNIEIARQSFDRADLVFRGSAQIVAAAIYGGQPLEVLEGAGALKIEGDRDLAARFVTLFPLPPKADRAASGG